MLVGLRGKVVWVVFWSADSATARSSLAAIESAWNSLKARGRFAMVAAAVEIDRPDRVRSVTTDSGANLPVYLASDETRRRFGASQPTRRSTCSSMRTAALPPSLAERMTRRSTASPSKPDGCSTNSNRSMMRGLQGLCQGASHRVRGEPRTLLKPPPTANPAGPDRDSRRSTGDRRSRCVSWP